jgi:pimeloyl-ACP methyl ester carboxylesterase
MELAHEILGSGPIAIVIHGLTESRESFLPILGSLGERYTVLAVDLRGHGLSKSAEPYDVITLATDVHDTLESEGLANSTIAPLVIGHSMGSVVASAYGSIFPSRAIINIDQALRLAAFKEGLGQLEPLLRGDKKSFDMAIEMIFSSLHGPLLPVDIARLAALRRADQNVVLGMWGTVFDSSVEELDATVDALVSGITVPYLSLHGSDVGDDYASWIRSRLPTATVELWPNHGHYPHLVDSTRFLERVRSFDTSI